MVYIFAEKASSDFIQEEVSYLNYLITSKNLFNSFFEKIGGEKTSEKYKEFFDKTRTIVIPKKIAGNISIFDKYLLRNPKNIFQYPQAFEDYLEVIQFQEDTLENLDKHLSRFFEGISKPVDSYYLLESPSSRKRQFQYVIEGIDDKQVKYVEGAFQDCSIIETIGKELGRLLLENPSQSMRKLNTWYKLGTSAVSLKKE